MSDETNVVDEIEVIADAPEVPDTSDTPDAPEAADTNSKSANGWPTAKLEPADLESYLSLRDSIHMFEWIALKFYTDGPTVADRTARAETILEAVTGIKVALLGPGEGCPPGFHPVGDRCIADA